jgi:phospholipid-binding lipoprotein MlaA
MKTSSPMVALFALLFTAISGLCQAQGLTTVSREGSLFSRSPFEDVAAWDERAYVEPGAAKALEPPSLSAFPTDLSPGQAILAQASSESQVQSTGTTATDTSSKDKEIELNDNEPPIPDPFEPLNRAAFVFNDGFYSCFLKPVTLGYKAVVSEPFRIGFRNAFYNLTAPIHIFNCMFQGKFKGAGNETARFFINTTLGFLGFFDQAKDKFDINKCDEDLGQTLGAWGSGPGFYIEWPFFGSSTLRDTVGFVGDLVFDPRTYIFNPVVYFVRPVEVVNDTSFRIGDYEALKKAALDPYVAKREAYHQYRLNKIKE